MANTIVVDILADTRNLVQGVKQTNSSLASINGQVSKVNSAFAGLASIFGAKIGISWFKDAIQGAEADEKAFKQLADLYGKDVEGIITQVNDISKSFYVDDGTIAQYFATLKSAFSSQYDQFVPDVVRASEVLSLLTGKPVEEIVTTWAKALRDGKLTAQEVQKLGIDLTSEQETKFNSLKTTAERLQFVLDLVNKKQKDALDNIPAWDKINYYVGQFKDSVGEKLIPVIDKLVGWFEKLTPTQQEWLKGIATVVVVITGALAIMAPFLFGLSQLIIVFKELQIATKLAAAAQGLLNLAYSPYLVVILAVIAAGVLLYKNWDTVKAAAQALWDKIKQLWQWVKDNWQTLLAILTGPIGAAVLLITKNWDTIKTSISNVFSSIRSLFTGWISEFTNFGRNIIQGLINGITGMLSGAVNAVKNVGSSIKNVITGLFGIRSPSTVFAEYGKNMIQGLANGIDMSRKIAVASMDNMSNSLQLSSSMGSGYASASPVNITINAGLGTDPYELGRVVTAAINKYQGVNGR
jgi:hypothetical protein